MSAAVFSLARKFQLYGVFRSMYFDEDGDLAHEFYEEVTTKRGGGRRMRKVQKNLVPQGDVEYPNPRLHVDFPIILFEG